jgi:2'-5' RNA ligase
MPNALRAFVAILIPEGVKRAVAQVQGELRRVVPAHSVRWTPPEQFHLTLKFLGDIDAQQVERLILGLRQACQPFPPLELSLGQIGFFPHPRRPRVVWLGVQDAGQRLASLERAVEGAVVQCEVTQADAGDHAHGRLIGLPDDRGETTGESPAKPAKEFIGHLTLGRIKSLSPREAERLAQIADQVVAFEFASCTADHIHLMQSQLSPSGAKHTSLAAIDFAG